METALRGDSFFKRQILPIVLTVVTCAVLVCVLLGEILLLNNFTETDIALQLNWADVVIGLTIYLKTSIDFAIFIGHLMHDNPGWKGRVGIEIGTAVGNALGTMLVLLIWTFFKEVRWLLALMILLASLVLFKMAEEGLEHAKAEDRNFPKWFQKFVNIFEWCLGKFNQAVAPVLSRIMPEMKMTSAKRATFGSLVVLAFTIPFILGLDDFAGYVPLFSVVNVFGFSIGVFLGHMVLNMLLYLSPDRTIKAVKNPIISLIGSIVFVGLGIWGLYEMIHLIGF